MKKFLFLPLAALAFTAACSESGSNPLGYSDPTQAKVGVQGGGGGQGGSVSSRVSVTGVFEVVIPGGATIVESGPGINEEGKEIGVCGAGGAWQNPSTRNWSSSVPHAHCTRAAAEKTVTWSFSAPATFVLGGSNINLNFDAPDHTVHFKGNQNSTAGQGAFSHEQDGGSWTLDLNQFDVAGNAFAGCADSKCLTAGATFSYGGTSYPATGVKLSW